MPDKPLPIDKELEDRGWAAMRRLLDQEMPVRRRRPLLWWWVGAGAALLALLGYGLLRPLPEAPAPAKSPAPSHAPSAPALIAEVPPPTAKDGRATASSSPSAPGPAATAASSSSLPVPARQAAPSDAPAPSPVPLEKRVPVAALPTLPTHLSPLPYPPPNLAPPLPSPEYRRPAMQSLRFGGGSGPAGQALLSVTYLRSRPLEGGWAWSFGVGLSRWSGRLQSRVSDAQSLFLTHLDQSEFDEFQMGDPELIATYDRFSEAFEQVVEDRYALSFLEFSLGLGKRFGRRWEGRIEGGLGLLLAGSEGVEGGLLPSGSFGGNFFRGGAQAINLNTDPSSDPLVQSLRVQGRPMHPFLGMGVGYRLSARTKLLLHWQQGLASLQTNSEFELHRRHFLFGVEVHL